MIEDKLLDSNILVYAFDQSEEKKQKIAIELIEKCLSGEEKFFVSLQNLSEFYYVVTTKIDQPIEKETALEIIKKIVAHNGFRKISPSTYALLDAMRLNINCSVPIWDCLIASTMLENNVYKIYTENLKDFKKVPNITSINPFE